MAGGVVSSAGVALVVEDSPVNRRILERALVEQGHDVLLAIDGAEALRLLEEPRTPPIDVVLLDLVMPVMDGYETLARIKANPALAHVPVIVISAVDDLDSVVRCIEMGATDYLPKPYDASILRARLASSLTAKHLRDLELEYLEQVGHVIDAAGALESDRFEPASLSGVAAREDALGQLARTFVRMAGEVRAREERLRRQVEELRIEIDESRQARKVAEITDTDYFRDLRSRAADLRRTVAGAGKDPANEPP
jgi:CheY-like chemotaxis protein